MTKTDELMALAGDYFDCGVLEGRERREVDTPDSSAQKAMHALRTAIQAALDEARAEERERCVKVLIELPGTRPITRREAAAAIRKGQTP